MTVPFPLRQSRCALSGREGSGYSVVGIAPAMYVDQCLRTSRRHPCNSRCAVSFDGRAHRARIVPESSWPCAMQSPAPQVTTSGPPCIGPAVFVYPASRCRACSGKGGGKCVRVSGLHMSSSRPSLPDNPQSHMASQCPVSSVSASMCLWRKRKIPRQCAARTEWRPTPLSGLLRCLGWPPTWRQVDASGTREVREG